jgi:signal transduction histidine kinase
MKRGRTAGTRRTWIAGVVVAGIVASLLLGWYWAGAADAAARSRAARARAHAETLARLTTAAEALRLELDELLRRESQRPYYHYSNLFRDPRSASTGLSLSPSPLASGPSEPLVAEHFQISAGGALTLPTLNDELPELSEPTRLAAHQRARDQLATAATALRGLALRQSDGKPVAGDGAWLALDGARGAADADAATDDAPFDGGKDDAQDGAAVERARERGAKLRLAAASKPTPGDDGVRPMSAGKPSKIPLRKQVQRLDPEVYAQNAAPTQVYRNIEGVKRKVAAPVPVPVPSEKALRTLDRGQVNIVTAPLDWHTQVLGGEPTLLALREVSTPDGALVQGLVIDAAALQRWLADRDLAELRALQYRGGEAGAAVPADEATADGALAIVDGWVLRAAPSASVIAAAAARADAIERAFLLRFAGVATAAALAGAFVVLLVAGAERLARERSQFAAAAAHELRTPLAGLQLYGDMLADGLGDPGKTADYARRLSEEAARLGRVVANVLGFSQLERGNLTLNVVEADVVSVVRELANRAEPALDRLGALIELDMPASLRARFDRDAVVRILGNLLDNAEKYGRAAADRTITLRAEASADAVLISVRDRGPGVDADTARRLFRPFSRGGDADLPAGLGLGLALSRSLAEAMGGALRYRRVDDQTEFTLRLQAG